jgi:HK97 family phage major capsid protein
MSPEEARTATPEEIRVAVKALEEEAAGRPFSADERSEYHGLTTKLAEFEGRRELLRKIAKDPRVIEQGTSFGPAVAEKLSATRDGGLRVIERHVDAGEMSSHASNVMERVVRDPRDPLALGARYLEAAGDPNYRSAFGKILADPQTAHYRFSREETAAVQKVTAVEAMRGMVTGTGGAGGFALPIVIDPSIMLSSSGAINPIRQLARQITISTTEWRGVSSAGVVASYDPEAGEVSDDTPTLAQPVILAEMWRVFVPYSIEIGQDFGGLEQELLQLTADARDVLDATKFYSGSGTDEPAGVQTGLSTSQRVQTAGSGAFVLADVYTYKQALPARAYANASWAWHPNRLDGIYRFVASGSTTEPQIMPDGRGGPLLGKAAYEWTALPTGVTTGTKFGLYGDFQRAFTIVDRLGITAEIVPTLFGATRRPTGERGFFCYGRSGSKVVVPEMLRYIEAL